MIKKLRKSWIAFCLSFACVFSLVLSMNAFAAPEQGDLIKDTIELQKEVKQEGKQKPGKEKFMFELVPANGQKSIDVAGITVEANTLETDGVGKFEGELKFSVDKNKISENNGWKKFGKRGNYLISYTLQEKNDGKPGWEYGTKQYDVVISYYPENDTLWTRTYLPGTDAAETARFTNIFKGVEMPKPSENVKPKKKENVKTGVNNEIIALISIVFASMGALLATNELKKRHN